MKKHIYALWAFFILFSQSIAASVEVRSTHMTTGDGVANNSIRYIYIRIAKVLFGWER